MSGIVMHVIGDAALKSVSKSNFFIKCSSNNNNNNKAVPPF
jgi:hypothetical protein